MRLYLTFSHKQIFLSSQSNNPIPNYENRKKFRLIKGAIKLLVMS